MGLLHNFTLTRDGHIPLGHPGVNGDAGIPATNGQFIAGWSSSAELKDTDKK
jgi:hypothetical protein